MLLKELFNIYGENLDSKSVDTSWTKCEEALNMLSEDSRDNIISLIHGYAIQSEKAAFANGIYYGIKLIFECAAVGGNQKDLDKFFNWVVWTTEV